MILCNEPAGPAPRSLQLVISVDRYILWPDAVLFDRPLFEVWLVDCLTMVRDATKVVNRTMGLD